MNSYNGSYKVLNTEWNQSLPELFETFQEALDAQQKWDRRAIITQIDGDSVDVVWEPYYETFLSNVCVR